MFRYVDEREEMKLDYKSLLSPSWQRRFQHICRLSETHLAYNMPFPIGSRDIKYSALIDISTLELSDRWLACLRYEFQKPT
jgi:hypothetical protein